jgi:hypothetical protein
MRRDPTRPKVYHLAAKTDAAGNVSALCYTTPHAIDLSRASWTIRREAVTCPRCRRRLGPPARLLGAGGPP